jgi:hypothetical protein
MAEPFQPIGAVAVNVLARVEAQAEVPLFNRIPGVAYVLARHLAKKAVTEQLRGKGVRLTLVKPADIAEQVQA